MLIIINVRRILKIPLLARHGHGYLAQGLSCRLARVSGISLIFMAEKALRITALRQKLCRGYGFGIFFGFGRFTVISISPYSEDVFHFKSFLTLYVRI